jgi:hypothetical protein
MASFAAACTLPSLCPAFAGRKDYTGQYDDSAHRCIITLLYYTQYQMLSVITIEHKTYRRALFPINFGE